MNFPYYCNTIYFIITMTTTMTTTMTMTMMMLMMMMTMTMMMMMMMMMMMTTTTMMMMKMMMTMKMMIVYHHHHHHHHHNHRDDTPSLLYITFLSLRFLFGEIPDLVFCHTLIILTVIGHDVMFTWHLKAYIPSIFH